MTGSANNNPRLRCAIYTRKSTEEGLDQEFNSLDAQYEACAAYVASQASLGWRLVTDRYDDGGISGGTMERPALQKLLTDIREHRVDIVVVYKIDRLTRSLADFAKMVEIFDQAQASFVSVTQQFNTTTSMGRLTLNVLLSFAQFEREVTAERIRDKIAASRKKGMWMGGGVPLGYRVENRKLIIDEDEAKIVRFLFTRYLELGSIRALVEEANANRYPTRVNTRAMGKQNEVPEDEATSSELETRSYRTFGRGQLAYLLSNPVYIGKARHRGEIYEGEHAAIIDDPTFERVQLLLKQGAPARRSATNSPDIHLLKGLVFDEHGDLLRTSHTTKNGKRYRYYVSRDAIERRGQGKTGWRLPAKELERAVERELERLLNDGIRIGDIVVSEFADSTLNGSQDGNPPEDQAALSKTQTDVVLAAIAEGKSLWGTYLKASPNQRRETINRLISRIDLHPGKLVLAINRNGLGARLCGETDSQHSAKTLNARIIECPISLRKRGAEAKFVVNDFRTNDHSLDPRLASRITSAHHLLAQVTDGSDRSLSEVAKANGVDRSDLARSLRLAFLSPLLTESTLMGTQSIELTARSLARLADLPLSWSEQERLLKFAV
ncbi:MAG: recombinase family protein [Rhizobiaceae bacterium]|nr:recombinase family protein [Rhizobiaceae bacterium]